jgi:hypothetical protein
VFAFNRVETHLIPTPAVFWECAHSGCLSCDTTTRYVGMTLTSIACVCACMKLGRITHLKIVRCFMTAAPPSLVGTCISEWQYSAGKQMSQCNTCGNACIDKDTRMSAVKASAVRVVCG